MLRCLQRGPQTVESLASAVLVTPNAVRSQLAVLAGLGLVEERGRRRGRRRPSILFGLTARGEQELSHAYLPLLFDLLSVLDERVPRPLLRQVLRQVGDRLADRLGGAGRPDHDGVARAVALLEQLGASLEVDRTGPTAVIRGHGCIVAEAVKRMPSACGAIEQLLARASGLAVRERCQRAHDEPPRCAFELGPSGGAGPMTPEGAL